MIKKILLASSLVVLFTGCASFTYSIKPEFDEKNKILTIDTLKFENAKSTQDLNPMNSQNSTKFQEKVQSYFLQNLGCQKIHYYGMYAGNRAYVISDFEEEIKHKYSANANDNCVVTEILNLKFFACRGAYNTDNIISLNIKNGHGYSSVERLNLDIPSLPSILNFFTHNTQTHHHPIQSNFHYNPALLPYLHSQYYWQ